jgi:GTP-binding protein Era
VVALLGRPNAGKSTLLNAVLGEKLAITTARPQTTRSRLLGVLSSPGVQIIFCDTPGINRGQSRFNLAMAEVAMAAAADADVRVLLLDAGADWDTPEDRVADLSAPVLLVRTKVDLAEPGSVPRPERFAEILTLSARTRVGLDHFLEKVAAYLPASPPLYPDDYLTDVPVRFLAAEQVREVAFEHYRDEIPYSLAVEMEEWKESPTEVRIRANLLVERESQKGIVVGGGGRMLKVVGSEARRRLSVFLGKQVHLQLWVKSDRYWTRRLKRARELGYL